MGKAQKKPCACQDDGVVRCAELSTVHGRTCMAVNMAVERIINCEPYLVGGRRVEGLCEYEDAP